MSERTDIKREACRLLHNWRVRFSIDDHAAAQMLGVSLYHAAQLRRGAMCMTDRLALKVLTLTGHDARKQPPMTLAQWQEHHGEVRG